MPDVPPKPSADPITAPLQITPGRDRAIAIGAMCAASIIFSLTDVQAKWLAERYSISQIVFFRGLFALVPVAVLAARHGVTAIVATRRPYAHLLRAGFAKKRKLLKRNLEPLLGKKSSDILQTVGIHENARAEDVPLEKWLALSKKAL